MTKEEVRRWFFIILIDLIIATTGVAISVRYTNKRMENIDPKLDRIIQLLEDNKADYENK